MYNFDIDYTAGAEEVVRKAWLKHRKDGESYASFARIMMYMSHETEQDPIKKMCYQSTIKRLDKLL